MKRRVALLIFVTVAGIAAGVASDFAFWKPNIGLIPWALLMSPIFVTLGGAAVTIRPLAPFFMVGGLLFWPLYIALAVAWLRNPRRIYLVLILLWTAQGFFEVAYRANVMLGV